MDRYRRVPTTRDVFNAVRTTHVADLEIFAVYTRMDGDPPEAMTEFGFEGASCPTIGIRTTWHKDEPMKVATEEYWLCVSEETA